MIIQENWIKSKIVCRILIYLLDNFKVNSKSQNKKVKKDQLRTWKYQLKLGKE